MKESFFTHDKTFYTSLFSMLVIVALQNVIAYSVNMADNIMLGAYSQEALSGAAVVMCLQSDQIFKCLPVFLRFRSYKWIHKLTR